MRHTWAPACAFLLFLGTCGGESSSPSRRGVADAQERSGAGARSAILARDFGPWLPGPLDCGKGQAEGTRRRLEARALRLYRPNASEYYVRLQLFGTKTKTPDDWKDVISLGWTDVPESSIRELAAALRATSRARLPQTEALKSTSMTWEHERWKIWQFVGEEVVQHDIRWISLEGEEWSDQYKIPAADWIAFLEAALEAVNALRTTEPVLDW